MEGKYSVELFRDGGEGAGIEGVLARHDRLATPRATKAAVLNHTDRLIGPGRLNSLPPPPLLLAHFIHDTRPRQAHELGERRVRPARATR
jgi:hypothetical protein